MKLKPLADRVILKQFKAEEKTKSGLILAASAQEKPEMFGSWKSARAAWWTATK